MNLFNKTLFSIRFAFGEEPIDPKADEIAGIAVGQIYFEKYLREHPQDVGNMALEATQKDSADDVISSFTTESSEKTFQAYGEKIFKDRQKMARLLTDILN